MEEGVLFLGGGIQLAGFGEIDPASLIIVKKIVGTFVKKLEGENPKKLKLSLKEVHKNKYEIKGFLDVNGKIKQVEVVDFNLFFAINRVLNKLR